MEIKGSIIQMYIRDASKLIGVRLHTNMLMSDKIIYVDQGIYII